ncbi:N-acetylmuramoyl-L-alanine amidase [Sutcliffiella horikoshii]|uniref:N-acetylmuramoyl-L-alanine amidase n=1 Tax=Sutcliffiella horikoshii TaxID=79883 RepID=A0A5D4SZD0_9BACI|nr:N-acetylmuramoyl-L-alanine amidase [Sutcliffiella horikoshii]TYS68061.1 N-acetylmuramoyl-L-alanine amidase [Sutcliffiella horikoshii]
MAKKKIYFDLGHGGTDPGAIGNGLHEKDVVLAIGRYIDSLMGEYENVEHKFSRLSDKSLTLSQRTDEANKWGADVLVSVHINAGGGKGFESFIYNGNYYGVDEAANVSLQNVVHKRIMNRCQFFADRGKKRANFHMVRESKMLAVLTECGFIDNSGDAANLKKQTHLKTIAAGHVEGVAEFLGLKKKVVAKPKPSGKLYKVQVGAYADKTNAEKMADRLKKDGYSTYIVEE